MTTPSATRAFGQRLLRTVAWSTMGAMLGLVPGTAAAEVDGAAEYEVKAAFVYNFAKFATWPPGAFAGPDAPLVLCVSGGNPFGPVLATLEGKPVGERRLAVREATLAEAGACHILFVARPAVERFADVVPTLRGRPVLTIGDSDDFVRHGGAINLVLDDGRVRFEVNLAALEGSSITLSSQVLRLARIVERAP
ncbi:YfiR family protein [Azospirillum sp. ST 5-10]|uniref:YfiR family protein n=1 Tax=unclassified Azospirillum TaxID=2630922 RepID=UPI003F4A5975